MTMFGNFNCLNQNIVQDIVYKVKSSHPLPTLSVIERLGFCYNVAVGFQWCEIILHKFYEVRI